ncbi:hypothetical protein GYMLUDRAFT_840324 [Collybiopsis luxurians FD-317 M1]|uniref:Uncharacterized protein n=1 Tax=Collybiopsis luxurians FD-317 M1 TaxID=944289 RepID=A0A0D0CBM3_9AGAR|nr:hypothetical protein GYMLUDRAFT_840324 [Collybiopsis luxurians FD-317 M1]
MFQEYTGTFHKAFTQLKIQGVSASSTADKEDTSPRLRASHATAAIQNDATIFHGKVMETPQEQADGGFFSRAHHFNINNGEFTYIQGDQFKVSMS